MVTLTSALHKYVGTGTETDLNLLSTPCFFLENSQCSLEGCALYQCISTKTFVERFLRTRKQYVKFLGSSKTSLINLL